VKIKYQTIIYFVRTYMSPKYSQVCSHIKYNHIFHCLICLIKTANVLVSSKSIICQARGFPRRKERGRNRVLACACLPVLSIICQARGFPRKPSPLVRLFAGFINYLSISGFHITWCVICNSCLPHHVMWYLWNRIFLQYSFKWRTSYYNDDEYLPFQ
jgi:hypothetical protein